MANTTDRTVKVKFDGDAKGFNSAAKSAEKQLAAWNKTAKASERGLSAISAAGISMGPAILPVLASATGLAVGLGASMAGAGAAAGVFGAVAVGSFNKMVEAQDAVTAAEERVAKADTTKERIAANKELAAAQKALQGPIGQAASAYGRMGDAWDRFIKANEPATMSILKQVFNTLAAVVPKLQPLFDVAAKAVQRFLTPIKDAVKGGTLDRIVDFLAKQAGPALDNIWRIATNVGKALGAAFVAFAPMGQGFLEWLADLTENLDGVSVSNGLSTFMAYIKENGPTILTALQSLSTAAVNIWNALTPLAPVSLAIATALASLIAAIPPDVIQALVAGFLAYKVALTVSAAAQWLLNSAMLANPIGAVVLVIAALVAGFVLAYKKSETFRAIVTAAWNGIKAAASAVGKWFTDTLWPWIKGVWDKISIGVQVMALNVRSKWEGIKSAVKAVGDWFTGTLWPALNGVWTRITGGVSTMVTNVKNQWNTLKSAVTGVRDWITSSFNHVVSFFSGMPARISSAASSMWNGVKNAFRTAINWIIGRWNGLSLRLGGQQVSLPFGNSFNIPSITLNTPNIGYLATGGAAMSGRSYLVGERGPELLTMGSNGHVTPNHQLGGDTYVTVLIDGKEVRGIVHKEIRDHDRTLKRRALQGVTR